MEIDILCLMSGTTRNTDKTGSNLSVKLLPEIKAAVVTEASRRARDYGARGAELRSTGSYLGAVALLHFLRLPPAERRAIYAEIRAYLDERRGRDEDDPLMLPAYEPAIATTSPAAGAGRTGSGRPTRRGRDMDADDEKTRTA